MILAPKSSLFLFALSLWIRERKTQSDGEVGETALKKKNNKKNKTV